VRAAEKTYKEKDGEFDASCAAERVGQHRDDGVLTKHHALDAVFSASEGDIMRYTAVAMRTVFRTATYGNISGLQTAYPAVGISPKSAASPACLAVTMLISTNLLRM
jgi:hypothetical protein